MRAFLGLVATVALALVAGCATMNVSSHVERGLDFSRYRTFDWGTPDALPAGDPRLERDPFFRDHVQGAVERALAGRGLELSTTPDLRVHYHASISTRIAVSGMDRGPGYCYSEPCQARITEYEAGTLVVDVVDVRTDRVIWRGWAQHALGDMLEDQDTMAERIDEAVTRMVAQWPGRR